MTSRRRRRRKPGVVHRMLVCWDQHERRTRHQKFYQALSFKVSVIGVLFAAALVMRGEHFTTTVLVARIVDAIGDVITDRAFHG